MASRKKKPAAVRPPPPPACLACRWTGMIAVHWRHRVTVAGVEKLLDEECLAACSCARGQAMKSIPVVHEVTARLGARDSTVLVWTGDRRRETPADATKAPLFAAEGASPTDAPASSPPVSTFRPPPAPVRGRPREDAHVAPPTVPASSPAFDAQRAAAGDMDDEGDVLF